MGCTRLLHPHVKNIVFARTVQSCRYNHSCPGVSYTHGGPGGWELAAPTAFTSAAIPSIFFLDFSLSSLMLPIESLRATAARVPSQDQISAVPNLASHDQFVQHLGEIGRMETGAERRLETFGHADGEVGVATVTGFAGV